MSYLFKKTLFFSVLILFFAPFTIAQKSDYLKIINNPNSSDSSKYQAYFELGWEHVSSTSDTSYHYATKAFMYAKKMNSRFYQAKVFNLLGAYFQTKGIYAKAVDYYNSSLKIGYLIDNKEIILAALGNIGAIYLNTAKHQKALDYLTKSEAIIDNSNPNLPNLYNNISIAYIGLNDYQKALTYAQKAKQLFDINGNTSEIAMAYASIATAEYKLGNNALALLNYKKSLEVAKLNEDTYQEVDVYYSIANLYKDSNKMDSAIYYAVLTISKGQEIKHYSVITQANELLVEIYKSKKNYEKAFFYVEEKEKYNDKYREESEEQQIEQKMVEFNFNKRLHDDSLKNAFSILERDNKIKENQAQIKQDQFFKIGLFTLIILASGFAMFAYHRFRITTNQNKLIEIRNKQTEEQKAIILQKNKEVTDSINYAKRIQEGLLVSDQILLNKLEDYLVFFKPKDIVSGDFYWSTEYKDCFYIAVCDSTGHGVPGAFMSLLNIALLSEAIKEKQITQPHLIFNEVRRRLIEIISADGHKDGFDGILIKIEKNAEAVKIEYAAANNEPVLIRSKQLIKLASDRMPVGKSDDLKSFQLHTINIEKGDSLYLYTDGYSDQFGEKNQKKFMRKTLNNLLVSNSANDMGVQWQQLSDNFEAWKGSQEQVDDVCVMGIKF